MPERFDRFTERARRVLTLAQEDAQRFNHNYIGTEHLLLGLVRETDCTGCKVLINLHVEPARVRSSVEFMVGRGEENRSGDIGLTRRANRVVELAVSEARQMNNHQVGTEHILLGLIAEGEGLAFGVLESLGVTLERARIGATRLQQDPTPPPFADPEPRPDIPPTGVSAPTPFTAGARRVLTLAHEEAQRFNRNFIGPEHLLLGLLQGDNVACTVLLNLGTEPAKVRAAIEVRIRRGERDRSGDIGLTPRAKRVLGLAISEARQVGHIHIGPEHLLLGLVREGEGIAFDVLESLGIGLERARTETARLLPAESPSATPDILSIEEPEERSPATPGAVAPVEETRNAAQSALRTAIRAIVGLSGPAFERDLTEALLLPRLAGLIEDLYIHSDNGDEIAAARERISDALRVLATASGVLTKHGHAVVATELNTACVAVTTALGDGREQV